MKPPLIVQKNGPEAYISENLKTSQPCGSPEKKNVFVVISKNVGDYRTAIRP